MRVYCLDTTAFIEPWVRRYPIDVFPTYWATLSEWGSRGVVLSSEEVLKEIEKNDDDLLGWARQNREMFRPITTEVQQAVRQVLASHPRLVDTRRNRSMADPFVVGQARVASAVVVTEENPTNGRSPKIPDVCGALGIPCMRVLDLIRTMELKY